ncbi:hypothetical protein P280DRAFT_75350 [Massarina eburnea CBS 473.64]|uniref:Uncharacterized protein n=1 Tax=Massarina eburnea CBS 473.64 TaxID=1395130 RepID=A0A6A6RT90_9PLEO|nr:hypothetical protein P280DRAFT_75350 [Massarina eburnea CBS 473.64]
MSDDDAGISFRLLYMGYRQQFHSPFSYRSTTNLTPPSRRSISGSTWYRIAPSTVASPISTSSMRLTLLSFSLVGAVLAVPYPQDDTAPTWFLESTLTVIPSTSLNIPITSGPSLPLPTGGLNTTILSSTRTSRHHISHTEPVPIFSRSCDCADLKTVQYPCWATDVLQVCRFSSVNSRFWGKRGEI